MMTTTRWITKIDRYGRVTIPAELRKDLRLAPGTRLKLELRNGVIYLTPLRHWMRHER